MGAKINPFKETLTVAPRKPKMRYVLPNADQWRGEIAVSATQLAAASGCSLPTVQFVLRGNPRSKLVCEKVVKGLQKLGHPSATLNEIRET